MRGSGAPTVAVPAALMPDKQRFTVPADAGESAAAGRLDQFLAGCGLPHTRSQLKRLIDEGRVTVAGQVATKAGHRLRAGDVVELALPPPRPARAEPQAIALAVVYEDEHLIAVDKPAGLVVHPAPGHPDRTLVNALLAHCHDLSGVGGELRPGIVHRLDRDTSGVMVATKTDAAHVPLAAAFKRHDLERHYLAVVAPPPRADRGVFDTPHARHPFHRKRFTSRTELVGSRGRRAVTRWTVERRFGGYAALVRCTLETGRTHQIRVQFADAGSPVVADAMYGRARTGRGSPLAAVVEAMPRQALHAAVLALHHPVTGRPLRFESPPPADFAALVRGLERLADTEEQA